MIWSFILAAVGILGIYLAGRKLWIGWAVGVGAQALWIAYAVMTAQWGFIITAVAYAWVYANNWRKWACETREELIGSDQREVHRSIRHHAGHGTDHCHDGQGT